MFANFLAVALAFPSVVYTVLLGVALAYWVFVMVGAAHIDALGDGAADGAADGAFDGADGGGHVDGADGGGGDHADGGGDGADGGGDGADGVHHGLPGMMASLKLRSAPATVVLSLIILFSWLFSIFGMQATAAYLPPAMAGLARFGVFFLSPLLALPFTSLAIRPLAPIFAAPHAAKNESLVGKVCTVRTGTVTDRFGEAFLEDGGAGLVVRVRVDTGETLKRGAQVVITAYDAERQEFQVASMDDVLDDHEPGDPPAKKRARR